VQSFAAEASWAAFSEVIVTAPTKPPTAIITSIIIRCIKFYYIFGKYNNLLYKVVQKWQIFYLIVHSRVLSVNRQKINRTGVFATTPMAAYAEDDYDGDSSETNTEQSIKQKNVGGDEASQFNCGQNNIGGESAPTADIDLCGTLSLVTASGAVIPTK
jgi:hypothetical protein